MTRLRPRSLFHLLWPLALLVGPPASSAPPDADVRAAYQQINAALARRDLDGALSYFTPDFTLEDESGTRLTRDRARRLYQERMGQVKTVQCRYVVSSVTPGAGGAWAEMRAHSEGTGEQRILFVRVQKTFTNDLWVRDLWVPTPRGWRLKYRRTLQDETHVH